MPVLKHKLIRRYSLLKYHWLTWLRTVAKLFVYWLHRALLCVKMFSFVQLDAPNWDWSWVDTWKQCITYMQMTAGRKTMTSLIAQEESFVVSKKKHFLNSRGHFRKFTSKQLKYCRIFWIIRSAKYNNIKKKHTYTVTGKIKLTIFQFWGFTIFRKMILSLSGLKNQLNATRTWMLYCNNLPKLLFCFVF